MDVKIRPTCLWMLKAILKQREAVVDMQGWKDMMTAGKFCKKKIYNGLLSSTQLVTWRKLLYDNEARPRALFIMWIAYHDRLATKDKLLKFGILDNANCVLCVGAEDLNHLFFDCRINCDIWKEVLSWMQVNHMPKRWDQELDWMVHKSKCKSWKTKLIKTAFAETIYACWMYRNEIVYSANDNNKNIHRKIPNEVIDNIVHRMWRKSNLRGRIAPFLL
ncbi:uncharacterized protein LOC131648512 [Vicia villosa]|uniref:uncharacterized protein LOC131648512 n=1 Tax=Vicia villosa TaxID=3911 RepID=UPI00273C4C8A|nr:uncharacterized protein LOC131648512 [Vicia villosa]